MIKSWTVQVEQNDSSIFLKLIFLLSIQHLFSLKHSFIWLFDGLLYIFNFLPFNDNVIIDNGKKCRDNEW